MLCVSKYRAKGSYPMVRATIRLPSACNTYGRHRASVARCSSESDLLHSAWRAGRVQKIRVGNMRWLGHFTAHFSDEVECPDAFVARLEVLLRMVVPVMLGVLRLRLEHHALAPQMWMIERECNAVGGCPRPSRSPTNCLPALAISLDPREKICAIPRGDRDA